MILAWLCMTLLAGVLSAPTLDCSPASLEGQSSSVRNMCALFQFSNALRAYLSEPKNLYESGLEATYNINPEKRQDVDHVFMRFGRRR